MVLVSGSYIFWRFISLLPFLNSSFAGKGHQTQGYRVYLIWPTVLKNKVAHIWSMLPFGPWSRPILRNKVRNTGRKRLPTQSRLYGIVSASSVRVECGAQRMDATSVL